MFHTDIIQDLLVALYTSCLVFLRDLECHGLDLDYLHSRQTPSPLYHCSNHSFLEGAHPVMFCTQESFLAVILGTYEMLGIKSVSAIYYCSSPLQPFKDYSVLWKLRTSNRHIDVQIFINIAKIFIVMSKDTKAFILHFSWFNNHISKQYIKNKLYLQL